DSRPATSFGGSASFSQVTSWLGTKLATITRSALALIPTTSVLLPDSERPFAPFQIYFALPVPRYQSRSFLVNFPPGGRRSAGSVARTSSKATPTGLRPGREDPLLLDASPYVSPSVGQVPQSHQQLRRRTTGAAHSVPDL